MQTVFADPTSPSLRLIALCLCMTHGLKAFRNTLFMSKNKGSRQLKSIDNVNFGWKSITETYKRDVEHTKFNCAQLTDLNIENIDPSGWSKMNVSHAKAPFLEKTINAMFNYLEETLEVSFSSSSGMYFDGTFDENKSFFDKYCQRLDILRPIINNLPTNDSRRQHFCTLEYSVHISNIFNHGFLDKTCHVTTRNIDEIESRMGKSLLFLINGGNMWKKRRRYRRSITKKKKIKINKMVLIIQKNS